MSIHALLRKFKSGTCIYHTNSTMIDRVLAEVAVFIALGTRVSYGQIKYLAARRDLVRRGVTDPKFAEAAYRAAMQHVERDVIKTRKLVTGEGYQYIDVEMLTQWSRISIVDPLNSQGDQVFLHNREVEEYIRYCIKHAYYFIIGIIDYDRELDELDFMLRDSAADFDY